MPACTKKRFLLLYGSETGQAQAIAEEINEAASNHDLVPELHCLSQTDKKVGCIVQCNISYRNKYLLRCDGADACKTIEMHL